MPAEGSSRSTPSQAAAHRADTNQNPVPARSRVFLLPAASPVGDSLPALSRLGLPVVTLIDGTSRSCQFALCCLRNTHRESSAKTSDCALVGCVGLAIN